MTHKVPTHTDQPQSEKSGPVSPVTLAETLIVATVQQEAARLATFTTMIKVATHPGIAPRSEAELEADLDDMPV